jgi:hypothetical protein
MSDRDCSVVKTFDVDGGLNARRNCRLPAKDLSSASEDEWVRPLNVIWIDTGRASNAEKQPTGRGPEGCVENGPAAALLLGYVSI